MKIQDLKQKIIDKLHPKEIAIVFSRETRMIFHWKILLVIFSVFLVVVVFVSFLTYQNVSKGEFAVVKKVPVTGSSLVTAELLNSVTDYYTNKKVIFTELQGGGSTPVDPSR